MSIYQKKYQERNGLSRVISLGGWGKPPTMKVSYIFPMGNVSRTSQIFGSQTLKFLPLASLLLG